MTAPLLKSTINDATRRGRSACCAPAVTPDNATKAPLTKQKYCRLFIRSPRRHEQAAKVGSEDPKAFCALLGKLIPVKVGGDEDNPPVLRMTIDAPPDETSLAMNMACFKPPCQACGS